MNVQEWVAQQLQNMAKSKQVPQQPQKLQKPAPNPRAPLYPHPVSTPNFVSGTPDWVKPIIERAANATHIPTMMLSAVLKQESGFNPQARSGAGALGIAQFMPDTARGMGVDPMNPESAINGAARYLANAYKKYGDWKLALGAYNAGGGNIDKYGGLPPFPETQNYVKNILGMAGEQHQSANGPYLDTINQMKKQVPQVLGTQTYTQRVLNAPIAPQQFNVNDMPTSQGNSQQMQKYPNLVVPIPQSDVVGPFVAPIPDSDVLSYKKNASDSSSDVGIRKPQPNPDFQ